MGKQTILNLFPGENILEIDLNLNEILKKSINLSNLENDDNCILRVLDLEELINKYEFFKDLLESTNIICIVLNSRMDNITNTQKLLLDLKKRVSDVKYYIIANFQDRKDVIKAKNIEKILNEKTYAFSAINKDSEKTIVSIIDDLIRLQIKTKEGKTSLSTQFMDIWAELKKARKLDTEGDRADVAEIFSNISSKFKKLHTADREEIQTLQYLCNAWECMAYAEEYKESNKFLEAMNHFIQASKLTQDNKLRLLALGNSEFCKILKISMEFEHSNEISISNDDYLEIKSAFEKMAKLYKQGEFEKELKWILTKTSKFDEFIKGFKKFEE
ncbi:MAG: hypothetical protein ACFE9S_02610 [Candidatus Hermodarchaeota archaeon]